ncbi:Abi family protein [Corynebacterium sp. HS2168-gen11]|uniref:Abi family protein n=1 Tax=Corynebacterium sp. HS2168-gen11 TaxID=2974027 RepID=UPI00216B4124|nr:Abi family protein [Corynebacterium sp. HS2168-gen11]MCS4536035.1 Abi family protein [Corynebacterium sp. HS2168-gen11]
MAKKWQSYDDQIKLLKDRGMRIDNTESARDFLSQINYYRFSGYFRHWQKNPKGGDDGFLEGTTFETIRALYEVEQEFLSICDKMLRSVEILLRTRFAYAYGKCVEEGKKRGKFAYGDGFDEDPQRYNKPIPQFILGGLNRSDEEFVAHYRDEIKKGKKYKPEAYNRMPVWVAIEVFTFGSLSRFIRASESSGVLAHIEKSLGMERKCLPGRVEAFANLRNQIAHRDQLWNRRVFEAPSSPQNIEGEYREYSNDSIYSTLVMLDEVATAAGISKAWLADTIEPFLNKHPLLAQGITKPAEYGQVSITILGNQFFT